jgi:aspartate/tyrosine/aromatic aminotransferase
MIKELKAKWWAQDIEAFDLYCRHAARLRKAGLDSSNMERLCAAVQARWPNQKTVFNEIRLQYIES